MRFGGYLGRQVGQGKGGEIRDFQGFLYVLYRKGIEVWFLRGRVKGGDKGSCDFSFFEEFVWNSFGLCLLFQYNF